MNEVANICFGDIPICRPFSAAILSQIDSKLVYKLYKKAFMNNPLEFNYVFVGNLFHLSLFYFDNLLILN